MRALLIFRVGSPVALDVCGLADEPAVASAGGFRVLDGRRGRAASGGPGCGAQPCERRGELSCPGPVPVEPELPAPAGPDQAAGDAGDAVAEGGWLAAGELAGEAQCLGPGEQVGGGQGQLEPAWFCWYPRQGRLRRPVALPALIRSSTRAWERWRTSRPASWPPWVSVRNAVKRCPPTSLLRLRRFARVVVYLGIRRIVLDPASAPDAGLLGREGLA